MTAPSDNPNWFANSPLTRLNIEKDQSGALARALDDERSLLLPLFRGDPLTTKEGAGFLAIGARAVLPADAPLVFLGTRGGRAHFAIDLSGAAHEAASAPFAELGAYEPLRAAAASLDRDDLAIIGHARWLLDWHRRHRHCANCGAPTGMEAGGAKRRCPSCGAEHFPRTDPVAIVLAAHEDACLLGRSPHFPPGFLSALAGFIEAAETPEECARRELFEEAVVRLGAVAYQFSQPWPFPSSLMMGFIAEAESRALTLDTDEIVEARWIARDDIARALAGEAMGFFLPPPFTIARQLIDRWAAK